MTQSVSDPQRRVARECAAQQYEMDFGAAPYLIGFPQAQAFGFVLTHEAEQPPPLKASAAITRGNNKESGFPPSGRSVRGVRWSLPL